MPVSTATLQGTLANPGAVGVNGNLFIEYVNPGSIHNTDGSYTRIVPNAPLRIAVVNGVVTPTPIVPNSNSINQTTATVIFRDLSNNLIFSETWNIIPTAGIFDVGTVIPIYSSQLPQVVTISSQLGNLTANASTLAPGSTATASISIGASGANVLNLGIPQGTSGGVGTTVYSTIAAGVAAVSISGYFYVPSANPSQGLFDVYQKSPGGAGVFVGSLTNNLGTIVFPTASSGLSASGKYFQALSTVSPDGLFDVYQNVSGVATPLGTITKQVAKSNGDLLYVRDSIGYMTQIVTINASGKITIPAYESRVAALEADVSGTGAASLATYSSTTDNVILGVRDNLGFIYVTRNLNGTDPFYEPRVATLETNAVVLASQVASLSSSGGTSSGSSGSAEQGPVAGSSKYAATVSATTLDTHQGFMTFVVPVACTDFQVPFQNASGILETVGPSCTITAQFEYPQGTMHPIFFGGKRQGQLDGGGTLLSDKRSFDVPAGGALYVHFRVQRAAGVTVGFPQMWVFGYVAGATGSQSLNPNTNTKGSGGNHFDAIEEFQTRTITDLVLNSGSTTATSASAGFTSFEQSQTLSASGYGFTNGQVLYNYVNPTTITLASAPTSSGTGITATLSATDKTGGNIPYAYVGSYSGFSPVGLFGRPLTPLKKVLIVGDSISQGTGANPQTGPWAVRALNLSQITNVATAVSISIPYFNMAMSGDTAANWVINHDTRLAFATRCNYAVGMLGTNDLNAATTLAIWQSNMLQLWGFLIGRGLKSIFGTIIPETTSTDGWTTTANQTARTSESVRISINSWMRDGCPINSTTGAAVAVGASSTTSNRCAVYSATGTLVNSGSGPGSHPLFAVIDNADAVESARNSGLWRCDGGAAFTIDGTHPNDAGHTFLAQPFGGLVLYLP